MQITLLMAATPGRTALVLILFIALLMFGWNKLTSPPNS